MRADPVALYLPPKEPGSLTFIFYLFVVVLVIQVIWLIAFGLAFTNDRRLATIQPVSLPVSVIVCAHDEEQNLRELIPLLLAQQHTEYELIIVDDRSNDGTYDLLLDITRREPRVRLVRVTNVPAHVNGKKYAITLGIRAAKYEHILLTDADCRPVTTQWINSMVSGFSNGITFVLGFSPYQRRAGILNSFIRFETLLTGIQYIGLALLGRPYMGVGRNLAYRKSVFLQAKGFNEYLGITGGDDDLFVNQHANASNTKVAIGNDALTVSVPKATWQEFFRQKLRHLSVGKYYRVRDRMLLATFTLSWIICWMSPFYLLTLDHLAAWLGLLFLLRWILLTWVFTTASGKLAVSFEGWKVPFLDFIYAFYYLVAGPVAVLSKKIRWKN